MGERIYGHTEAGEPITADLIEELSDEAERGYDVDVLVARRGRPRLGSEPSTVEPVP